MAVTIEDLYRNYGILADAKDSLSQVNMQICFWYNRGGSRHVHSIYMFIVSPIQPVGRVVR